MLVLHGELDHVTALAVWMSVELALADGWDEVIVDLSALSFMDAGGLNLLFALRDLDADGIVSMVDGSGEAARVLRMLPGSPPLPNAVVPPSAPPG
jgi:anti-anti-sigma factor